MAREKAYTKKVITKDYERVPVLWKHRAYGVAEFVLMPIIRNGKICEVLLYPQQQPGAKHYYSYKNPFGWDSIMFGSFHPTGSTKLEHVYPWAFFFLAEHGCMAARFYVPEGVSGFFVSRGLSSFLLCWY